MKYRIKFSKFDKMRFIGHLDLLKFFQRAINRANLPVSYSKGFNPHQIISFAIPLPLGMSSIGEYVDIEFDYDIETEFIMNSLNNVMIDGIEILSVRKVENSEKNCASAVSAAIYNIECNIKIDNIENVIYNIINQNQIMIERISKNRTKIVDIRPDILEICNITENQNFSILKAIISTGSSRNLKPDLLMKYIYDFTNNKFEPLKIKYKRIDLLKYEDERLIAL